MNNMLDLLYLPHKANILILVYNIITFDFYVDTVFTFCYYKPYQCEHLLIEEQVNQFIDV